MEGAELNALLLIERILFVTGVNAAQRAVSEAATACDTLYSKLERSTEFNPFRQIRTV